MRITERASRDFRAIPGVRGFGAHIGRAVQGEEITASTSPRTGSASIRRPTTTKTLDQIRETVDAYPGLFRDRRPI